MYKAVIEIESPKSPFDRYHISEKPSRTHYVNKHSIFLRVSESCTEKEVYNMLEMRKETLKKEIEKRLKPIFGIFKVREIYFKGEKETNPDSICHLFIFEI
jgi:hypothetical protein